MSAKQLSEVRQRSDSSDVRLLLWEIKRLRALVLRANQLLRCLDSGSGSLLIRDILGQELSGEPCIEEAERDRLIKDL
ncbi:hypothetical protein ASD15_21865 [Massilia sp. Root351]|uniref:hypothetical protein n=1 Tax=Massilia sp. Root351 TaxID=1736522 RepID=UPI00070EE747|nr:hypothetical protein [Massilia sp. Root351]KQV78462.1 hypothetical protein ASD15_21865 [Massilia sp. Root351]